VPSPVKQSPRKDEKKSFELKKQRTAEQFLKELDAEITQGKVAQLSESTGGVRLVWTKTLNTTAGRANWRRETLRTPGAEASETKHKHHVWIELAEKVIDDEDRLLNVLAHEFCHLATFMIDGVTDNPHGRHFKSWAAKCSNVFASRGIHVTTKHSYEIDFKYIWQCTSCFTEFKRHSRSIDPRRHRCGSCKNTLLQVKPKPRATTGQPSEYQVFVKEQMKVVRLEFPGCPQKDVMKKVAERWASRDKTKMGSDKAA
jgi:predicted SprT family Zn-dependent metalloprotease